MKNLILFVFMLVSYGCSSSGEALYTRQQDRENTLIRVTLLDSLRSEYRIDFGVPKEGKAQLVLLDAAYSQVRVIETRFLTVGWFRADLDAQGLKPGEYYIDLQVDGFSYYKKPIILK
jgi:hypothetical protein